MIRCPQPGETLQHAGRTFRIDSVHFSPDGTVGRVVAECEQYDERGRWWVFDVDDLEWEGAS